MIEELRQVDESVLTTLHDLRREREALKQRLARMQEAGSEVPEKVLARVRGDYEARIAALADKAAPLQDTARGDYGRLLPLLEKAREACETLRLDQEELALRHRLGEFDDDEHRDRTAELDSNRRTAEEKAAAISEVVERLAGAFDSPAELAPLTTSELRIPAAAAGDAGASGASGDVRAGAAGESGAAAVAQEEDGTLMLPPEPPAAPAPPPRQEASDEPPVWVPSIAWRDSGPASGSSEEPWKAAAAPFTEPPAAPPTLQASSPRGPQGLQRGPTAEFEPEAPTSGLPAHPAPGSRARLEALDADLEQQPHYLEPLTFIGRTPENQIRIYKPAVSRRHAQITETDEGWMLRDLSSENGTYVNGQRVTERLLAEGDRVQFGTSRFVLHLAT